MNNIVYTKANLLLESYSTLCQIANPEHESNIRHIFREPSSMPEKQVLVNKLLHYFDQVEATLDLPLDRIEFFFKEPSHTISLECRGSLFLNSCLEAENLSHFLAQVKSFNKTERFKHIRIAMARMLSHTAETLVDMEHTLASEAAIFEEIFKHTDLSDVQKYDMFYIYYHYETLLEEFINLLEKTLEVIEPLLCSFEEEIAALVNAVQTELDDKGISYFSELFNIDLGKNSHYYFYPCITNAMTLSFNNINTSIDCFNIFFGMYVLPFMQLKEAKGRSDKEMAHFLKALADPNKLQILKLIKENRLYASQLAEKLGISNATVSHHMNALLQLEIIKFEKEQNKFYYALEKEQLKSYFDNLYKQFDF